ncbi:MAG: hypothetical protein HY712_00930 [candidate division NC10 bacterium]|nr:hypothetical protein [candidate division NC10 bacterium]
MNRLTRYSIYDAYTLEEVRREYEASDVVGRIRLLRKVYRTPLIGPPYEIVLRAVEDPNPQLRAWIARHGKILDFRECHSDGDKLTYSLPERNLEGRLQNDPDPFVRACLLENKVICPGLSALWSDFGERFQRSSPLERLALVRNPEVPELFIEKLFDYQKKELGISTKERTGLIVAYLTNESLVKQNKFQRRRKTLIDETGYDEHLIDYAGGVEQYLLRLWELAGTWPAKSGIPCAIYETVVAPDSTKAKVYRAQKDPDLRQVILYSCDFRDKETLKLGREDSDSACREAAISTSREPRKPPADENLVEFRDEVQSELQSVSWALRSLRVWVITIGMGVLLLLLIRFFPNLLR